MLTQEINQVLADLLHKKEPSVKGPEADQLREKLKKEIADMKEQGIMVEIPFEIPDMEEKEKETVDE